MTYSEEYSIASLKHMLTYCRPHKSASEWEFIERYILPHAPRPDGAGNLILRVGTAPVLWSCHTDTVHRSPGRQRAVIRNGIIRLAKNSTSTCLGADDTAGVWLMCNMIHASVEGLYIFHRGEEVGGIGSNYIAARTPKLLAGIKYAIALDRGGYTSVITHQFDRCCSDTFARALGAQLGAHFRPDATGLFTDTANYTHLIPECTNISVGYEHAHTNREIVDPAHLVNLLGRLIKLDISRLPVKRRPNRPYYPNWSPQGAPKVTPKSN